MAQTKPWRWAEGGVEIDGAMHGFAPVPREEVAEILGRIDRGSEVVSTLSLAKKSFATGDATYAGSAENLESLIQELDLAQRRFVGRLAKLEKLFVPPISLDKIPAGDRSQFAYEAMRPLIEAVTAREEKKE